MFVKFRSKFTKVWEIRGFPVRLTKHLPEDFQCRPWRGGGGGGGGDIFWNSPLLLEMARTNVFEQL